MNNSEILIYQNSEGSIKIDVRLEEESAWLTQAQLCELFQKSKATISEHIKNVFEEGELDASQLFGISELFKPKVNVFSTKREKVSIFSVLLFQKCLFI
jgi:hypothetical protein